MNSQNEFKSKYNLSLVNHLKQLVIIFTNYCLCLLKCFAKKLADADADAAAGARGAGGALAGARRSYLLK